MSLEAASKRGLSGKIKPRRFSVALLSRIRRSECGSSGRQTGKSDQKAICIFRVLRLFPSRALLSLPCSSSYFLRFFFFRPSGRCPPGSTCSQWDSGGHERVLTSIIHIRIKSGPTRHQRPFAWSCQTARLRPGTDPSRPPLII